MATMTQRLNMVQNEYRNKIDALNAAVRRNDDLNTVEFLEGEARASVKEFNKLREAAIYRTLGDTENPMEQALMQCKYNLVTLRKVTEKETGVTTYAEGTKSVYVDLYRLDSLCGGIGCDSGWRTQLERVNIYLAIKVAKDLGSDYRKLDNTENFRSVIRSIDNGKTPWSTSSLMKEIKKLADLMDNAGGKVLKCHIKALTYACVSLDKARANVFHVSAGKKFYGAVVDTLHAAICNKEYTVLSDAKEKQSSTATAIPTEESTATEATTEATIEATTATEETKVNESTESTESTATEATAA